MKSSSKCTVVATSVAAIVAIALAGCASTPQPNAMLEQARVDVLSAKANSQVSGEAQADLATAEGALGRGDAMLKAGKSAEEVNHEAYLAERFALSAQQGAALATSQKSIADAHNRRNSVLLGAREDEVARGTRLNQMKSQELDAARIDAQKSAQDAQNSAQLADVSAQQNAAAQQRARELESALADLQARQTDHGLVITLGDVLFATGRANLKSGSRHSLDKLATFLHAYPQRNVQIQGFTDSVGSDDYNQGLSERRAESVRDALTGMGIASGRIQTRGFGKNSPVSDNDSATGRQQNRRVEVVISEDDAGRVVTRLP
jgi:outer membrane protein OmpA-like peptidoglycan-associated protein